jgi:hypothetical protein
MHILCKFKKIDKNLLDSLARGFIYFSHPDQLNDPFDCRINISKSLNRAIQISNEKAKERLIRLKAGQKYFDDLNFKLSNAGVFSCSHNLENAQLLRQPLLWSHYADGHRGVCLIYNIPDEYILKNNLGGIPVTYEQNPIVNFLVEWAVSEVNISYEEFIDQLAIILIGTKDMCWSYENEYRILAKQAGEFKIEKSFLKHMCYGLNVSSKDFELISSMLIKFGYDTELLRMHRMDDDFGIIEKVI